MAEVFSTIGGVASIIDVVLRACNLLYDSSRYLKDAPQLSQRLRQTIESIKSILQDLGAFVAEYRSQQAAASLPDILPAVLEKEVKSIRDDLDVLSALLPSPNLKGQTRANVKWVLNRKKVVETIQALDSHQATLTLALQTFTQRNDIRTQENILQGLEQNNRQHGEGIRSLRKELKTSNAGLHANLTNLTQRSEALLPSQEALRSGLTDLYDTVSAGQSTINAGLDNISTTLSQMSIRNDALHSSTVVTAPTEDVLARIFRAELLRVLLPTVEQCFDQFKASPDPQLAAMRRKIDEMAHHLSSSPADRTSGDINSARIASPEAGNTSSHIYQDSPDLAYPHDTRASSFGTPTFRKQRRLHQQWIRYWTFHWKIGTVRVSISTAANKRQVPRNTVLCPEDITSVVEILLALRADVNAQFRGSSPLHDLFRTLEGDQDSKPLYLQTTAIVLLNYGADPSALTDNGHSVMDIAEDSGWSPELSEALQKTGYGLQEVKHKIELAKRKFHNPSEAFHKPSKGYASSTAIDNTLLVPASQARLRGATGARLKED
ncbi:MAG: hypothetical protein Q9174_005181 [Haloplaca sp. 1 TL-2023]